jgi:biopolymer transport protein ExbB
MLTYLLDGGPIMLPLLLLSILTLAIIIDRVRAFRAAGGDVDSLRGEVNQHLMDGELEAAIDRVRKEEGPVAACLLMGLQRYHKMRERGRKPEEIETTVSKTMEDYAPKAISGLEKRLNLLVLIASVSPLLGMTGTVTGMIKSFDKMAASAGLDPAAVSGGIAEALITTAAGLLVAIPAVVAYNLFTRRVEEFNISIEECVTDVVTAISEH